MLDHRLKNEKSITRRPSLVRLKRIQGTIHVCPPSTSMMHMWSSAALEKRQEDRNNEKYGLDLQREITIIREWWNVNTYS